MMDDSSKNGRGEGSENGGEGEASFFNRMRSDVFRRKVEGVLRDGVMKNIAREMKLPREIVTHLLSQIDETKQATLKLVSKEVRLFLENTNLSEEMAKLLSQLSFEVSTKVRFVRNDPPCGEAPSKKQRRKKRADDDNSPKSRPVTSPRTDSGDGSDTDGDTQS